MSNALTSGVLLTWECPSQGLLIDRHGDQLRWENGFQMHTCQSRAHTPTTASSGPISRHLHFLPWTAWDSPCAPDPFKLFKQANPGPVYPASPISSCRNHAEVSCPHFPSLPLPPHRHWCCRRSPQVVPLGCQPPLENSN